MFKNYSKAGTGAYALIVTMIIWGGNQLGFSITESMALELVQSVTILYGIVMSIWGTFDRDDLKGGLVRKTEVGTYPL